MEPKISITPLLTRFADPGPHPVTPAEIASALGLIFTNQLSQVQCASLLTILSATDLVYDAAVIQQCAARMRDAAVPIDLDGVRAAVTSRNRKRGSYLGGVCDIVGTGGDGHSTFNVSTTASIIGAAYLLVAKHGARASSSKSGSADMLQAITPTPPRIEAVDEKSIIDIYRESTYSFLFAPTFHAGMKFVAPVRKELGFRTIFNILGPLANPLDSLCEARVIGVAKKRLGPVFSEALRLNGVRKGMVVCGAEELDEVSCAGKTLCWRLVDKSVDANEAPQRDRGASPASSSSDEDQAPRDVHVEAFELSPADFGLPVHPLSEVRPGKGPAENAEMLVKLLNNKLSDDDPTLHFVLINTAALFVVAGVCDANDADTITEVGPGDGRWKEGVRLARKAVREGRALQALHEYISYTHK